MKTIILSRNILFFFAFTLVSFSDPYTIKRVSDKNFRYEFYTTDKKIKPKENKTYYWFKGGLIHESQGGVTGDLLNGKFTKTYHNNKLAKQGEFKNGLRVGVWKTWHTNGVLATTQDWYKGLRSGKFFRYDENGNLIENGKFTADIKTGKWINREKKDTLMYKRGGIVIQKPSLSKSEKYKLKQDTKKIEANKKAKKELEVTNDAKKLANYKTETKEEEKKAKENLKEEKTIVKKQSINKPKKDSKMKIFFKNILKKK
ncbi:hypothetical protein OIU80_11625 [Flavobacterium sp. LS1R47]|uniref:MORN repeat protein n=1 Tax=Flavobacterium frigoritolerans TaxID=2987686 RepID=A0A9X2ZLE6_9FLAO|nr:hypothetical protein [Flavobacterium frigoritolerans]MCV9932930.1 hypothetical protein [Flavobacterium frigoritolerans]